MPHQFVLQLLSVGLGAGEALPPGREDLPAPIAVSIDAQDSPRTEILIETARIMGIALSVGTVWWVLRAGGMAASLLASVPAWRHLDPLPVLGREEEQERTAAGEAPDEREEQEGSDLIEISVGARAGR